MGKIRVKTIGDEELEKKDQKKAHARAEAKRAAEAAKKQAEEETQEPEKTKVETKESAAIKEQVKKVEAESEDPERNRRAKKKTKFAKTKEQTRSTSYLAIASKIEKDKKYKLSEAVALLPTFKRTTFDETVELHINTTEKGISGNVTLPHGTGKQIRIVIANQSADTKAVDDLITAITSGQIDFDILIATPDTMPRLAKVARVLGPRGLMPNPKNGTVTPKPDEAAKKFSGGQMHFKTESKFPLLHMVVGKLSFGEKQLQENIKTALTAVNSKKIKSVTLKSTMSPGIKIDVASI